MVPSRYLHLQAVHAPFCPEAAVVIDRRGVAPPPVVVAQVARDRLAKDMVGGGEVPCSPPLSCSCRKFLKMSKASAMITGVLEIEK